jgi:hypothetical protein
LKITNRSPSKIPPTLTLFLLSPAIAELLSGSAPPIEFFNPLGFVILASLYGSGAILARELTLRWGKGYLSLLLLGAAYGVIEEGLMVKSFFDPAWPDLGVLGVFGRWMGINWVWVEMLIIYHAVFSITIPVLLVELAFPSQRKERWVGSRALGGFAILLAGVVFLGYFAMTPYRPPLPQYFSAVILTAFFIFLAWKIPSEDGRQESTKPRGPASFFATALLGTISFFTVFWLSPNLLSPLGVMLLGGLLVFGFARFLKRLKLKGCDDIRRFALASGGLAFFIFLAPLQELDKTRLDNPQGMGLVGLAFLIGLLLLGWQVRRRTRTNKQE